MAKEMKNCVVQINALPANGIGIDQLVRGGSRDSHREGGDGEESGDSVSPTKKTRVETRIISLAGEEDLLQQRGGEEGGGDDEDHIVEEIEPGTTTAASLAMTSTAVASATVTN